MTGPDLPGRIMRKRPVSPTPAQSGAAGRTHERTLPRTEHLATAGDGWDSSWQALIQAIKRVGTLLFARKAGGPR
jgi:hypothetical protein